jgi:uncharacterized membrane protein HdeD (DUF308 family)
VAICYPLLASFTSAIAFGVFLIIAGILQIIFAFASHLTKYFLLNLFTGILAIVVGALMVANPAVTLMTLTLLIGGFLVGIGIFRILSSLIVRFESWGWILFNGIISLILGILILVHWPKASLWIIGLFIGIELLIAGWTLLMEAFFTKKVVQDVSSTHMTH